MTAGRTSTDLTSTDLTSTDLTSTDLTSTDLTGTGKWRLGSRRNKNHGFSLLEVMVAIGVLSVVVLAISLIPALGLGRNNDTRTYAVNLAREVLDSYRSFWQDSGDFRQGKAPGLPLKLRFGCTWKDPLVVPYTIDPTSYALTATAGVPKVRQVTVVIDCPKAGQVSLSTYIGDPSPAGS
jgi:prepilin-type N-terminal cleavage/methylation domain-containing protein